MERNKLDTLLTNGKIYTMESEGHKAEAVGIKDGRIVFVGSMKETEAMEADKLIDLQGKTVLPGMGDSHLHLYAYCQNQTSVKLDDVRSMEELIDAMKQKAEKTGSGRWIKGAGFDHTKFRENRLPTRWDLDRISMEHPIVIRRCCLHLMAANSMAIRMAGVTKQMAEQSGGLIEVDDSGELSGIFREKSILIFDEIVPDPLSEPLERKKIFQEVLTDMASKGITSINTYAAKIWNYEEDIDLYRELDRDKSLPVRVRISLDDFFEKELPETIKNPYNKVKQGAYKLFTDGSLGARSASLFEPYSDDPANSGVAIEEEKLRKKLEKAYDMGLQPAIHAIGDRALETALDLIEGVISSGKSQKHNPGAEKRRLPFRIIHAQMVTEGQLERMRHLPVVLDIQPVFLCTDLYWIESRLGSERIRRSYLWKTLMHAGLMLTGGSDCPVESYDPMKGIYAAVMRQDTNGFPHGGWLPEEKLTVYEAVSLFTKNIPYAEGDEDVLGTVAENKFADLVVLDQDPFSIDPAGLLDLKVLKTFVAGELVFDSEA
ncbi:amidohydrolase [Sinanaerobacter chloroacetimidivorans]|uniref:Amidohydrolase n=1 Tax=Sinanaerobacter chloroacetimidivorans TaxID=2818044 RepID=A0A8J7W1Q2_9FIRM|nr:amidohydrolase [Sinanaerobacter chloroacetimidivorans]MBR0599219.1 amidohydrolase [Sinanaerobacter chloroacetimidivorans]